MYVYVCNINTIFPMFPAYAKMHEGIDNVCSMTSDRWSVCIGPSEDGMQQVSFVNGICTTKF